SGTMQVCDGSNWGNIGIGVPTGTIAAFAAASCPNGWSEYTPARGRFLRGIDNDAGNDPDGTRAAGSTQGDAIGNHKHEIAGRSISNKASGASTIYYIYDHGGDPGSWSHNSYNTTSDPSTRNTATESRSKNVAVTFCV